MSTKSDKFTELLLQEKNEKTYSDFTMNLDPHPDTGDLFRLTNDNSVKASLKNIVLTSIFERFYNPTLGGDIQKDLFENMTDESLFVIQSIIQTTITNNEERVNLISVTVTPSTKLLTGVDITITYNLINITGNEVLELFITKVR